MLYSVETEHGTIEITKSVIAKIVTETISSFEGKVFLTNHNGKVPGRAAQIVGTEDSSYMEIVSGKQGIDVKFYVVISFGSSIGKITSTLIDEIQSKTFEMTGIELNSVAVVVTGMLSKHMAKRHLEFRSH